MATRSPNTHSPPSTTTGGGTSLQEMSAAAAASALDMRPKIDLGQTQKTKKLVRRNASDKLKLIQMVHDNPILWDSRLPNFKGAEEEKNRAWEFIGREFSVPGRRVARAFKSLRESYRRELAHVKVMGSEFKPKWSLYEAMDFLRDVIRERKSGTHTAEALPLGLSFNTFAQQIKHANKLSSHSNNNNNSSKHTSNNNNNNNSSNSNHNEGKLSLKFGGIHIPTAYTDAVLNLSKCSQLNLGRDDYYFYGKQEIDLSAGGLVPTPQQQQHQQPLPAHQAQLQHHFQTQLQLQQHLNNNDSRVSSTRNDTNANNSAFDDIDISSVRSIEEEEEDAASSARNTVPSNDGSEEVEELDAIDADFPYPLILDSNSSNGAGTGVGAGSNAGERDANNHMLNMVGYKRRRTDIHSEDATAGTGTDDDYDDQLLQQYRHMRQHQASDVPQLQPAPLPLPLPLPTIQQTAREELHSKFCGFISAKLNHMDDTEADALMNRILLLLVQTQSHESK